MTGPCRVLFVPAVLAELNATNPVVVTDQEVARAPYSTLIPAPGPPWSAPRQGLARRRRPRWQATQELKAVH